MKVLIVYKNEATRWVEIKEYIPIYREVAYVGNIQPCSVDFLEQPNRYQERVFIGHRLGGLTIYIED